jgi:fructokinase
MILAIGEILIDQFPGYNREGGAPFNFAYHLKHLGLPVRLVTRLGNDANGQWLRRMLFQHGFELSDIQIDPLHKTGVVDVVLDDSGIPTFQIVPDVAYDYLQLDHLFGTAPWRESTIIYYGSLIQRSKIGFQQVGRFLNRRGDSTRYFCDINLRAPHYSRSTIIQSLMAADILKLNDHELDEIRNALDNPASAGTFIEYLMHCFDIEMLVITRGAEGSTLIMEKRIIDTPPAPPIDVVDTVGAGDAYAAMFALGIFLRLSIETIAGIAGDFAAQICQLPGAVPKDSGFYDTWKTRFGEYL